MTFFFHFLLILEQNFQVIALKGFSSASAWVHFLKISMQQSNTSNFSSLLVSNLVMILLQYLNFVSQAWVQIPILISVFFKVTELDVKCKGKYQQQPAMNQEFIEYGKILTVMDKNLLFLQQEARWCRWITRQTNQTSRRKLVGKGL